MMVYDIDKHNPALKGCMATVSGRIINLMEPATQDYILEDIAHGLSANFRWNGHTVTGYTIAEHCLRVSERVSKKAKPYALFHDAEEAYWGDMIRPIKMILKDEGSALIAKMSDMRISILKKFGIEYDEEIEKEVKEIDNLEMSDEFDEMFLRKSRFPMSQGLIMGLWLAEAKCVLGIKIEIY